VGTKIRPSLLTFNNTGFVRGDSILDHSHLIVTWRSPVGIANRLRSGHPGIWVRFDYYLFSIRSRPPMVSTQPHIQWLKETDFPEVKRQACESDHSSACKAKIKTGWDMPPMSHDAVLYKLSSEITLSDRFCGLVVRVLGYRSGSPGSIPGTTRKKCSGSGTGSTQPREYNWGATW
jgi:hypothetical protein